MPPLTGMVNQSELLRLFNSTDPADKEKLRAIGPGFTDSLEVSGSAPQAQPIFSPMATSLQGDTPSHPGSGDGGQGVEVQEKPQGKGPGFDWKGAVGIGAIGLSDLANVIGNPRARYTPQSVEMIKQNLQQQQLQQLQQRHQMWDDVHKQSQELPSEILTDPKFSGLAAAKAALDKDLADGKIDNEKNVSTFLTEQHRVKRDLEQLQQQTKVQDQLAAEQQLNTGRSAQQAEMVQKLQQIMADPGAPPELKAQAEQQLSALPQAQDWEGRKVFATPLEMTKLKEAQDYKNLQLQFHHDEMQQRSADRLAQAAQTLEIKKAQMDQTARQRVGNVVRHQFDTIIGNLARPDKLTGQVDPAQFKQAQMEGIKATWPILIQAAPILGIEVRPPDVMSDQWIIDGHKLDEEEAYNYLLTAIS